MRALTGALPTMKLPDSVTTVDEAGQLINDWLDAQHERARDDYAMQFILMAPVQSQLQRAHTALGKLDLDPGPGPSVRSSLRGLIGEPQPRSSGSYVVDEPEVSQFGIALHGEPLKQLASIVADLMVVRSCAARAARCADVEREQGRHRQAERWSQEAAELITYANDLESQLIEPTAAHVLDELRAHEAKHTPAQPAIRPVRLR